MNPNSKAEVKSSEASTSTDSMSEVELSFKLNRASKTELFGLSFKKIAENKFLIGEVQPDSIAYKTGLRDNDLIVNVTLYYFITMFECFSNRFFIQFFSKSGKRYSYSG